MTNESRDGQVDVTVIVPTRDRPELLRKTLTAIAAQSYEGVVEAIVVFDRTEVDGSLDSNDARRPVRTVSNQRKPGLAGGRNTGLELASGTYIAFCDDDDTWSCDKLALQLAVLESSDMRMAVGAIDVHFEDTTTRRVPDMGRITFDDLLRSRIVEAHPSSFVFERSLVDEVGMVDEALPGSYAEDYEYLLRIARVTDIAVVPDAIVNVLWHTASFFVENWQTRIDALTYLLGCYPEFDRDGVGKARIEGQIAFAHAAIGNRSEARRWSRRTLRSSWRERRAYLALLVSTGLVSADTVVAKIQRFGRGI